MTEAPVYRVARASGPIVADCRWEKPALAEAPVLSLECFMGERPSPMPVVQARLLYDRECLHVIFHVVDHYVRCLVEDYQGPVWGDSCVEFFFTPGSDIGEGYFNIETNCGGSVLFMHQTARGRDRVPVAASDAETLSIARTMPRITEQELPGPLAWLVEYRVAFNVLARYAPVSLPAPGVTWRANFHKCAETTSHPHYLTWSPILLPRPDFHRKEFFGTLLFL
jgi:hypothetical protein